MITLLASAARTVSSQGSAVFVGPLKAAVLILNVTAAAAAAGDTLDVYVQHSPDEGTTWDDFVHFTQVLGNGGPKKFVAKWFGLGTPTTPLGPARDGVLAAGVEQGPTSGQWRVKWIIGGATPNFTFSVVGQPMQDKRR